MSTDTTAIGIPPETTTTRRAEPPVNVYVRIRPFIGDELTRGENQNMLCIRDEKRIAVKLYPTATNNIRPAQTSYNEYEVQNKSFSLIKKIFFCSMIRSRKSLIITVLNKNYSSKFSNNLLMKYSQVQIGFYVHLV